MCDCNVVTVNPETEALALLVQLPQTVKNAHIGGVNRHFQPNLQNIKNCILSKLLHRFQPHFRQ